MINHFVHLKVIPERYIWQYVSSHCFSDKVRTIVSPYHAILVSNLPTLPTEETEETEDGSFYGIIITEIMSLFLDCENQNDQDNSNNNKEKDLNSNRIAKIFLDKFTNSDSAAYISDSVLEKIRVKLEFMVLDNRLKCSETNILDVIKHGHIETLFLFLNMNVPFKDRIALTTAASNGHMNIVQLLFKRFKKDIDLSNFYLDSVITKRHNEIFKYIVKMGVKCSFTHLAIAVLAGNQDLIDFLSRKPLKCSYEYVLFIAEKGDLDLMKRAVELTRFRFNPDTLDEVLFKAMKHQHTHIVQYLLELKSNAHVLKTLLSPGYRTSNLHILHIFTLIKYPISSNNLEMTACLLYYGIPFFPSALYSAFTYKHIELIEFLIEVRGIGENTFSIALENAARFGDLDLVKFYINRGTVCSPEALASAASNDHSEVAEVLLKSNPNLRFNINHETMERAIFNEHYEVAKVLIKHFNYHSIPLPESILQHACEVGHYELVQEIMSRMTTFEADSAKWAAFYGHFRIIELFVKKGKVSPQLYTEAAKGGQIEILKLLLLLQDSTQVECPADAIDGAAESGRYACVKLLLSHNKDCTTDAIDKAAQSGHFKILELLLSNGKQFTNSAREKALENGHSEIVDLLDKYNLSQVVPISN